MPKGIKGFQKGHKSFGGKRFMKGHKIRLGMKHSEQTKKKMSEVHKGQHNSPKTEFKATGRKGWDMLGGKNEYRILHKWIVKKLGQPTTCSKCGKNGLTGHQIHWANISGEYKKDMNDWERLCVRCHYIKDRL